MGKLTVIRSGLYTTVQDEGRFGFRKFGVPVSGAMDHQSYRLANLLVNNSAELPVIEITLIGPTLHFNRETLIAITGADLSPRIEEAPVGMNTAYRIKAGQTLTFGKPKFGARAYLAVKGLKVEKRLQSYSMYNPVTDYNKLADGDEVEYQSYSGSIPNSSVKVDTTHFQHRILAAFPGPDFDILSNKEKEALLERNYTIAENNRMGYQLNSTECCLVNDYTIITAPVQPGTVQLTPSGKLLVLMRDGQVTGGYPRILQLTEESINQLAQKRQGQEVEFRLE